MTLDDFFTLTEMNNGLTAPSRVRELMAIMQKERDCIVKNPAELTRQWSAVASAIAATENKECLDLFIQLDGLHFMYKWLKDAHKFTYDSVDGFVEESISHLLRALKKLHIDYEKSVASEIWAAVQDLLVHNSLKVQDEARALSESWRINRDCDAAISDVEKPGALTDDEAAKGADPEGGIRDMNSSAGADSVSKETSKEKGLEMTREDEMLSTNSDAIHTNQFETTRDSEKILDSPVVKKSSDRIGSPLLPRSTVEPPCYSVGTAIEPCSLAVSKLDALDTHTDINDCNSPSYQKQSPKTESSPQKLGLVEESKSSEQKIFTSSSVAADEMEPANDVSSVKTSAVGERVHLSYIDCFDEKFTDDNNGFNHHMSPKTPSSKKIQGNTKALGTSLLGSNVGGKASTLGLISNYNLGEKQTSWKPDLSEEPLSMQQDSVSSSGNLDGDQTKDAKDMANSQIGEAAREEANLERGTCDFDLNDEVFLEDADHPGSQNLTPTSIVAASRAAAAPALPHAPLQFEGDLGWKVSAATSAFRRASPNRMLENSEDASAGRSGISSKQPACLDIDLNVGQSVVMREGGSLHDKCGNVFGSLPSGESSECLALDLNLASEDGGTPDWRVRQFFPHGKNNSHSSSSSKQPTRNINLNYQPSFLNDSSENCRLSMASQNTKVSIKSDDSAISIMGRRVEINRKDFVSAMPTLSNGQTSELAFDVSLARTDGFLGIGSAFSVYGYNNVAPVPSTPFSYGSAGPFPAPYTVDSRGSREIVGSSSALPTGFSQPPFAVNSTQVGSVDEQLRSHSQPAMSSALSGKRKEPDNGWEHYPNKPCMPPWKNS